MESLKSTLELPPTVAKIRCVGRKAGPVDRNERAKPEPRVESITSIFALRRPIKRKCMFALLPTEKPVDSTPYTVDQEPSSHACRSTVDHNLITAAPARSQNAKE